MADRNPLNSCRLKPKARLRKKSQPEWIAPILATLTDERFKVGWRALPLCETSRTHASRASVGGSAPQGFGMALSFRFALSRPLRHAGGSASIPQGCASKYLRLQGFVAVHGPSRNRGRSVLSTGVLPWEGVIAKNGDSVYVSRRTRDWLKFKCSKEQEFVIGGYTETAREPDRFRRIAIGLLPWPKARLCRQGRDRLR
jgi:hypothetical protein